ncbi:MAG: FkbM family methyltransferase [Patescibacteria group bacterium]|nr:FkbM family methyltransferase [Patescibacteria group bacterium]
MKTALGSVARGEFPRLSYPITLKQTELNQTALFTAHNEPELWYLRHHGDEGSFLNEFLQTVKSQPECTVFDVGSYIGYWSIFAAFQPGVKRIYAFEPNSITRRHLIQNLNVNKLQEKINVEDEAVTDSASRKVLFFEEIVDGSSSLAQRGRLRQDLVTTISLDQFVRKKDVTPDIVKIDVEGAEGLVLTGMKKLLELRCRPSHIFLELHPQFLESDFHTWPTGVVNQLTGNHYQPVSIRARKNGTLQCHFGLK